jgi:hypothetical protein
MENQNETSQMWTQQKIQIKKYLKAFHTLSLKNESLIQLNSYSCAPVNIKEKPLLITRIA